MNTSSIGTDSLSPQNDFKPFATGEGANVLEQSEYERSGFLKEGFKKGMARSSEINKAIRQGSSIAAAVARFTASKTGEDMLDNGDIDTLSQHIETAIATVSSLRIAEAQGEADHLTASFTPELKELRNGQLVHIRAKECNRTKNLTLNTSGLGARPIIKGNNLPLEESDIAGAGHWLELQYDEPLDKWVLQNPAKGITPQSGVPVGTLEYFAMATPPAGYLKADGSEISRETCPDLYRVIGTTYGEGDGSTTFNLPDLIGRFPQGSATPGKMVEAGLPDITGRGSGTDHYGYSGSLKQIGNNGPLVGAVSGGGAIAFDLSASRSNPVYGKSNTVQPPSLTLLPCIKAFDAVTNPGLINVTELANGMTNKADCNLANLTTEGKSEAAGCSMPSDRYINMTLGSGTSTQLYTAPANGYFTAGRIAPATNFKIAMNTYPAMIGSYAYGGNEAGNVTTFLPVKKGESIQIYYNGTPDFFRFIYADGDQ